jgi:hypothetical protein
VSGATAKQNYSSHRHDALFVNTQIATSLSACRFGIVTHRMKRPKKIGRKKAGQLIW